MAIRARPTLFVRPSSGLVKEVSPWMAIWIATANQGMGMSPYGLSWWPGPAIFGFPPAFWAALAMVAMVIPMCFVYMNLVACMPRSGGDYVFTSRVVHPLLGYWEAILLFWGHLFYLGGTWAWAAQSLSNLFYIQHVVTGEVYWLGVYKWLRSLSGQMVFGLIMLAYVITLATRSSRTQYKFIAWWTFIRWIAYTGVLIVAYLAVTPEGWATALQRWGNTTPEEMIVTAQKLRSSYLQPLTLMGWLGIISLAQWSFFSPWYVQWLGGELKGRPDRVMMVGSYGSIIPGIVTLVLLNSIYMKIGYESLAAWGVLWDAGKAPFKNAYPTIEVLSSVCNPELSLLYLGYVYFTQVGMGVLCYMGNLISVKTIFAMSIDRMMPKWLSDVNPKTRAPLKALIFCFLITYVYFIVYALTQAGIIAGTVGLLIGYFHIATIIFFWPYFICPALAGILLKWRRKDIYSLAPGSARIEFFGIPLIAICAALYIGSMGVIMGIYAMEPIFRTFIGSAAGWLGGATRSGFWQWLLCTAIAVFLYYYYKRKNAKLGIDIEATYKMLPPE